MNILKIATLALCVTPIALPVSSQTSPGKELAELSFDAVDVNERGKVDLGEFINFGRDVLTSMDSDDDDSISQEEFLYWDFGFRVLAEEKDRVRAYEAAQKIVFDFWDRDGDNLVSKTEHLKAMTADFRRADLNDDAYLSKEEFLNGFSVIVAIQAALRD